MFHIADVLSIPFIAGACAVAVVAVFNLIQTF
jgi:hypothetical protein